MWLIEDLNSEDLQWKPPESNSRTIISYFRHIINAEIYWLKQLGIEDFSFIENSAPIEKIKNHFKLLEKFLIDHLEKTPNNEIGIIVPEITNGKIEKMGSLVWLILRTSLHAVHHFGQISHIRYTIGKPPNPETQRISWGQVMDLIVLCSSPY